MDGITFGMEICFDHAQKRLKSSPDGKNIQIQLIPAAGMDIRANSVACVPQGLVFLVDGSRSKAVVQVNGKAAAENVQATVAVPSCANACFPNAANQKIELFGPFNIAFM